MTNQLDNSRVTETEWPKNNRDKNLDGMNSQEQTVEDEMTNYNGQKQQIRTPIVPVLDSITKTTTEYQTR